MSKGHGDRYIGSLFRVDEPVPDDSSNQAKKLLNNKKLPKSLAVSFIFLTFATTFARVKGQGHGDRYIGSLFMVDEPVPDDLEPTNNHNQKVISVIIKKK